MLRFLRYLSPEGPADLDRTGRVSPTSARSLPPRRSSSGAATAMAVFGGLLLSFGSAGAQQYVVDDAEIVDPNVCHVEAWHGERSSWFLPACQLIPNLEIAAGVGFIEEGLGHRETEYAVEAKTLIRPLTPGDWGVGLVLGVGPNPSATAEERRFGDIYGFVPLSVSTLEDRLVLHGNLGWVWPSSRVASSEPRPPRGPAHPQSDPVGSSLPSTPSSLSVRM